MFEVWTYKGRQYSVPTNLLHNVCRNWSNTNRGETYIHPPYPWGGHISREMSTGVVAVHKMLGPTVLKSTSVKLTKSERNDSGGTHILDKLVFKTLISCILAHLKTFRCCSMHLSPDPAANAGDPCPMPCFFCFSRRWVLNLGTRPVKFFSFPSVIFLLGGATRFVGNSQKNSSEPYFSDL